MTISTQQLLAYADGELDAAEARAVEAAIAADPLLAARLEAEKHLRATLKGHLDPVAQEPVPEAFAAMIAAAREDDLEDHGDRADHAKAHATTGAPRDKSVPSARPAPVLDFAAAKARREEERKARAKSRPTLTFGKAAKGALGGAGSKRGKPLIPGQAAPAGARGGPIFARPGLAAGLAASLVVGVLIGTNLHLPRAEQSQAEVIEQGGRLLASGDLAKGLDTQLASARKQSGSLRILTSFRDTNGYACRVYTNPGSAGIACNEGGNWVLERTLAQPVMPNASTQYRQAGSPEAELLQAAQAMAQGSPFDASAERAAREAGWKPKPLQSTKAKP